MKKSAIRKFLIIIQTGILIFGCARTSVPTGGPKDKEIPVILKSVPENGAKNFRGNEIIVSFDEYVALDQITEKFMVSPPMKKRPDIFTKGKSIRIGFENELRDSTTYTFYFQDAIRDLNEGNAINNYQFVFSTGPFIDSLSVTGNVYLAPDLDPPENALVLLYNQPDDSSVVKQLPDYITRAEKNGEFRIDNVRTGTYRLYALVDADNSKNYNSRDEFFAFYSEPVTVTPEKNYLPVIKDTVVVKPVEGKVPFKPPLRGEYPLVLFQAERRLHYLTSSSRKSSYQLIYTLSLPPDSLEFDFSIPGAPSGSYFLEKTRDHDTIMVWLTDSTVYNRSQIETIVQYPFTDTLGITGLKADTIDMRYIVPRAPRSRIARRVPYKVEGGISGQVRPDRQIILTASAPFLPPDTSKLLLYEMLKEEKIRHPFKLFKDTTNSCRYFVESDFKPGKSYLFIADSAAFRSIYGEYSDSTGNRFSVRTQESFGKLILDIKGYEGNRIIQLLDNSEKLVRQTLVTKNGKLEYPLLEKGPYRLRAIFDLNNDGKWTTGDFDTHRQPEPVLYYPEEFEIKENWEIIQPWEMEMKNSKEPKLQKIKTGTR
jgi:hypothetical protein